MQDSLKTFEIQIGRVLKSSPYHVSVAPTEIALKAKNTQEAVESPEILKIIGKTYGKRLRLVIQDISTPKQNIYEYQFEKQKAILSKIN